MTTRVSINIHNRVVNSAVRTHAPINPLGQFSLIVMQKKYIHTHTTRMSARMQKYTSAVFSFSEVMHLYSMLMQAMSATAIDIRKNNTFIVLVEPGFSERIDLFIVHPRTIFELQRHMSLCQRRCCSTDGLIHGPTSWIARWLVYCTQTD